MLGSIANSLGFGSGLNVSQLVSDLATASRAPKIGRIDAQARATQAKISAVAQARSDLDGFATALKDLLAQGTLSSQPSVSDETMLSASANRGTPLGSYAGSIEILQLAGAQSVYSALVPAASDPVGLGGMTLTVGTTSFAISIDNTNNSLTGLADAINASGSAVRVSIATDNNQVRLVLKGETGAAQAFTLTADAGADPGLQQFAYGAGGAMQSAQAASDAQIKVDGTPYSRTSNSFSDVIPGMTLNLKRAVPGQIVALGSTRPTEGLRQAVTDFVAVFNQMKQSLKDAQTAAGGTNALRVLDRKLSAFVNTAVSSDPAVSKLTDIGVSTNRDGTLSVNTARLEAALTANPDAVEALFNPRRDATHTATTDPGISDALDNIRTGALAPDGLLGGLAKGLAKEAAEIAKNRERIEAREDAYRVRLEKQYSSLDARIGAFRATQSYLEQQIKLWSNEQ
jgi:flagellar hook-associated protein 2